MRQRQKVHQSVLWIILAVVLVGLIIFGIWREPDRINHDCALYLQEAELLLDGAMPYRDFVETNPPLIIYLNALPVAVAKAIGVSPIIVFHSMGIALLIMTSLELRFLSRQQRFGFSRGGRGLLLLAWTALYYLIDRYGDAGQREHLFVLLYVPFVFLRILRYRGGSVAGWFALLLGVQAGLGVSLKPHFLAMAVGVEAVLYMTARSLRSAHGEVPMQSTGTIVAPAAGVHRPLLCPEIVAAATVVLAYLLHWLFVPAEMRAAFFGRWLPLIARHYHVYDLGYDEVLRSVLVSPVSLMALIAALVAAWLPARCRRRLRLHLAAFATLAVVALVVMFVQCKGWSYQAIPLDAAGLLCLTILTQVPRSRAGRLTAECTLVAAILVLAAYSIEWTKAGSEPSDFIALRRIVEERTSTSDRVLVIATSVRPAYPMLLQLGRQPGSRYLCAFPIAFAYDGHVAASGVPIYRHYEEAHAEERRFLDELADDVNSYRPKLIVIHNQPGWLGLPDGFNTCDYLVHSGWTERALGEYHATAGPDQWKVFERR